MARRAAEAHRNPPATEAPTNATLAITDSKLYVPVLTLSTKDDNKLLEQLKAGFKEQLNGTNTDQNWLIRLKLTIYII